VKKMPRRTGQKGFQWQPQKSYKDFGTTCLKKVEFCTCFSDMHKFSLKLDISACSLYPLAYAALATDKALALLSNGPFEPQNQPDCFFTRGITLEI
jgi:hypothetical protein